MRSEKCLKKDSFQIIQNIPAHAFFNIVFVDTLRPSHQFFGNIGTFPGSDLY